MSRCCHFTRREFLRWAALVAATPLLPWEQRAAYAQSSAVMLPINLELVTLTETSAIVTWFTGDPTDVDSMGRLAPVPADTEVLLGTSPADLTTVFHDTAPTPYHYVELTNLEPDQLYFWVARSNGQPAVPSISAYGHPVMSTTTSGDPSGPFVFHTPTPPPGRHLFTIALCADMHMGETVAGLATTQQGIQLPPGITQIEGRPPYAEVMADALWRETRARGAQLLVAAGDVTSEAAPIDTANVKRYLDAFGPHGRDYFVTRGNHDRHHEGQADSFKTTFFPNKPTWFSADAFGMRILGLDTYDKIGNGGDNGVLGDKQWAFVREELAHDRDRPTLVVGHHPVSVEATLTSVPPLTFDMDRQQADQLEQLFAASPGVFLHHAGHTHRNKRTTSTVAPGVMFQEVSAVKEYPGGFTLMRVFTGGYALNFYKFKAPLAQEWAERSRPEYLGLAPFYVFGNAGDRNSVTERDFSGLRSTRDAAVAQPPPATVPTAVLPATGDLHGPGLAAAALAGGLWARRARPERRGDDEPEHRHEDQ